MCDYSLHVVKSRDAKKGDKVVTSKFPGTLTRGLACVHDRSTAVCLLPGTELSFDRQIEISSWLFFNHKTKCTTARFRKLNEEDSDQHHDALELADGQIVYVTELAPGQFATVLVLPVHSTSREESSQVNQCSEKPASVFQVQQDVAKHVDEI